MDALPGPAQETSLLAVSGVVTNIPLQKHFLRAAIMRGIGEPIAACPAS